MGSAAYVLPRVATFSFGGCLIIRCRRTEEPNRKKRFAFVECQRRISPLFFKLAS